MDEYSIQAEHLAPLIKGEMQPLLRDYHRELRIYPHLGALDLDAIEQLQAALETAGVMHSATVRHGDELIGFASLLIQPHTQFGMVYAQSHALYIDPARRRGRLALRLVEFMEQLARKQGAQVIAWGTKFGTPAARLFALRGYHVQDVIYSKEL